MISIVGLDLSLTSTGIACDRACTTIVTKAKGALRLQFLRDEIVHGWIEDKTDLVLMEGYSYGSKFSQGHSQGELGGVIKLALFDLGIPFVVLAPTKLKTYACGKGNAPKDQVLVQAVKRSGIEFKSNDEADAFWLYAMGRDYYGGPLFPMPVTHRKALAGVEWPDTIEYVAP